MYYFLQNFKEDEKSFTHSTYTIGNQISKTLYSQTTIR